MGYVDRRLYIDARPCEFGSVKPRGVSVTIEVALLTPSVTAVVTMLRLAAGRNAEKLRAGPWRCITHVGAPRGVSLGTQMLAVAVARERGRNAARRAIHVIATPPVCAMRWPSHVPKRSMDTCRVEKLHRQHGNNKYIYIYRHIWHAHPQCVFVRMCVRRVVCLAHAVGRATAAAPWRHAQLLAAMRWQSAFKRQCLTTKFVRGN